MRRQFPERHALKNRLHYLLTRQRSFALWKDANGKVVTGFAVWQEQKKAVAPARFGDLSDGGGPPALTRMLKGGKEQDLGDAVATIFNHFGGPIEFDELVSNLANLLGIRISRFNRSQTMKTPSRFNLLPADQIQRGKSKTDLLERLWEELQQLPLNQRTALLLNLKDASGGGCITLSCNGDSDFAPTG